MFTHHFKDEVYGSQIMLLAGVRADIKAVVKDVDPTFDGDMDFEGRCIECKRDGEHYVVVMLPEWPDRYIAPSGEVVPTNKEIAILVHELFHATEYIMWEHDIEHNKETQECWAYLLDSLVRRALEILP